MSSIYKLNEEFIHLRAALEDQDGEFTQEQLNDLLRNEEDFKDKLKGYVYVLKSFDDDLLVIDSELKRLKALKESKNKAIERLKDSIIFGLNLRQLDKYDGGTFKLGFRKSHSLMGDDVGSVPDEFKEEVTTIKVDKTAFKRHIKDTGNVYEDWYIQESKNLQIR